MLRNVLYSDRDAAFVPMGWAQTHTKRSLSICKYTYKTKNFFQLGLRSKCSQDSQDLMGWQKTVSGPIVCQDRGKDLPRKIPSFARSTQPKRYQRSDTEEMFSYDSQPRLAFIIHSINQAIKHSKTDVQFVRK